MNELDEGLARCKRNVAQMRTNPNCVKYTELISPYSSMESNIIHQTIVDQIYKVKHVSC